MPELPEVETIRQDLVKKIVNKKIVHVKVIKDKAVGEMGKKFVQALVGNYVTAIHRRGKLLIATLKNNKDSLLIHLRMTGQLIYVRILPPPRPSATPPRAGGNTIEVVAGGHKMSEKDIENLPNKSTQVVIVFADGAQLFFNDQRRFGYMKLASPEAVDAALKRYGPEPLSPPARGGARGGGSEFTFNYFSSLFVKRKNTTVKALLLNQELIAGLGNIYVDEVCFCAGVRPQRRVKTITALERKKIFKCIPEILKEAIQHRGTTFRNFLDSSGRQGNYTTFLRVYDRAGEPCRKCKTPIQKTTAAGRGTHFCPKCQK